VSKFINYYEILGIQSTATESEIRKAYHTLAKQYHPDRNHDSKANYTMQLINQSYEVLKNPGRRSQFDALLRQYESSAQNQSTRQGYQTPPFSTAETFSAWQESSMPHQSTRQEYQTPPFSTAGRYSTWQGSPKSPGRFVLFFFLSFACFFIVLGIARLVSGDRALLSTIASSIAFLLLGLACLSLPLRMLMLKNKRKL
jgi:curved DNA-binding protein CbpA